MQVLHASTLLSVESVISLTSVHVASLIIIHQIHFSNVFEMISFIIISKRGCTEMAGLCSLGPARGRDTANIKLCVLSHTIKNWVLSTKHNWTDLKRPSK